MLDRRCAEPIPHENLYIRLQNKLILQRCRRFGRQVTERLLEPFLTGVYAGDAKELGYTHGLARARLGESPVGIFGTPSA